MDGYLKIKTKIDNKDIDKGITELENKIKKLQTDNSNKSQETNFMQKEIESYERLAQKADEYKARMEELTRKKQDLFAKGANGVAGKLTESQLPEYGRISTEMNDVRRKYAQATAELDKQAPKIDKTRISLSRIKTKQEENNAKITEYKQKIEQINMNNMQNSINGVGNKITSQISKIGKMAMAVVGIRTAWGAVRSAIGMVSQYNSQVSTDFEYMRFCIANMLAPAIQWLVSLLYKVLGYVNAIMSAWFGINIFSRSSAKAFQKMQKSAGGTAKSAKEIKNSLQGFDEMEVLQDNSSNDSGSGGGVSTPSVDLSGIQGDVPAWLQWIIDNKDLILSILGGIAAAIIAIKLGASGLQALGIGLFVAGILFTIQTLLAYLQDPSWTNFGKIIEGIGLVILGLGILIGNVPLIIAGAIVLIAGIIVKHWEEIKNFFQNGIDWLKTKMDWVKEKFGLLGEDVYNKTLNRLQGVLNIFDSTFKMIKGIFDGLITFIKGVFTGDWSKAWEGIKQIFSSIFVGISNIFGNIMGIIKGKVINVGQTTGEIISNVFKAVVNAVLRTIENVLNSPIRAINGLIGVVNSVPGINLNRLRTFNLPRLAKGGIVDVPGKGIPIGGGTAIAGEAGREGVIPLTDIQAMETLGETIGRYININANIVTTMNGRVISRQLQKIRNDNNFAYNS